MTGTTFSSLHQNRRVQLSLLAASRRGASEPLHRKQQKHACEQRTAGRNVRPDFKSVRMRAGSRMHSRMLRGAYHKCMRRWPGTGPNGCALRFWGAEHQAKPRCQARLPGLAWQRKHKQRRELCNFTWPTWSWPGTKHVARSSSRTALHRIQPARAQIKQRRISQLAHMTCRHNSKPPAWCCPHGL